MSNFRDNKIEKLKFKIYANQRGLIETKSQIQNRKPEIKNPKLKCT
jgi:hypothetical protein